VLYKDRTQAGMRLAAALTHLGDADVVVLGLPRGGVPVAECVAEALQAPLDVLIVRKLGVPFQPELAMGAVGEEGVRVVNEEVVRLAQVPANEFAAVEARERRELERRAELYRGDRPRLNIAGRTALIVDDGVATGSTARAACQVARALGAERVVLAVPVGPVETASRFARDADEVICLQAPEPFYGVGRFYGDFSQITDEFVTTSLRFAAAQYAARSECEDDRHRPVSDPEVQIRAGAVVLTGDLSVPVGARGIVAFAHGSGSSRHSPRNRLVARVLNQAGLGTLLFDLLTSSEEHVREHVFDIGLLANRLTAATAWLRDRTETSGLSIGYFGASTGAAAALVAAAEPESKIGAIVSRGGRPDLAAGHLGAVRAPTLLIVGGHDREVLELNRSAEAMLLCESRLAVVPGATHLFEEPGTLQQAAELARQWFCEHLGLAS
jgi:putative phosphoribosyl transferase